jgi:hypothetical protein
LAGAVAARAYGTATKLMPTTPAATVTMRATVSALMAATFADEHEWPVHDFPF